MWSDRSSSSQIAVRPLIAGAAALDAAGAFVEEAAVLERRVEGRFHQLRRGDRRRPLAVDADLPHQPLGQHAVERRHELVGLDAHVQEAAEHVEHVVGVDGREHQVAGQRRLDGDLRGLRVADLADHDLVGVVTQDRAQAARERQPLLLVDRDLGDPAQLVFDRIFDRQILSSIDLISYSAA